MSTTTHASLLSRVRNPADHAAWREFDARYGDLVLRFCASRGLQHADAEDVRQLVMFSLSKVMPGFLYSRTRGRFRTYLGQVVHRAVIEFQRKRPSGMVLSIETSGTIADATEAAPPDAFWEQEWIAHHYRLAMRTIRATFEPRSLRVFDRLLSGCSVADAAQEFQLSEQAVHKIKQRIRNRLRQLIARQIEDEEVGG